MVEEGKAQQDKAEAQRDVAKKEAEAESARAGATAAEKRQEATSKKLHNDGPSRISGWAHCLWLRLPPQVRALISSPTVWADSNGWRRRPDGFTE